MLWYPTAEARPNVRVVRAWRSCVACEGGTANTTYQADHHVVLVNHRASCFALASLQEGTWRTTGGTRRAFDKGELGQPCAIQHAPTPTPVPGSESLYQFV